MRITKTLAEEAAKAMAEAVYDDQIKNCHVILATAYEDFIVKVMPKDVFNCCKKYPNWISTSNEVYIYVNGERYFEKISFGVPIGRRDLKPAMQQDELKEFSKLISNLNWTVAKKREFQEKTAVMLLSMKTRQRIEEMFPEAMEYIKWPSEPLKNLPAAKLEETRWMLSEIRKRKEQ